MAKVISIPNIVMRMEAVRRAVSDQASNKDITVRALVDATMDRFNGYSKPTIIKGKSIYNDPIIA